MIGPGLLISPVLEQGATSVRAYFPKARWFDFYTHELTSTGGAAGEWLNLPAPIGKINVTYRYMCVCVYHNIGFLFSSAIDIQ